MAVTHVTRVTRCSRLTLLLLSHTHNTAASFSCLHTGGGGRVRVQHHTGRMPSARWPQPTVTRPPALCQQQYSPRQLRPALQGAASAAGSHERRHTTSGLLCCRCGRHGVLCTLCMRLNAGERAVQTAPAVLQSAHAKLSSGCSPSFIHGLPAEALSDLEECVALADRCVAVLAGACADPCTICFENDADGMLPCCPGSLHSRHLSWTPLPTAPSSLKHRLAWRSSCCSDSPQVTLAWTSTPPSCHAYRWAPVWTCLAWILL